MFYFFFFLVYFEYSLKNVEYTLLSTWESYQNLLNMNPVLVTEFWTLNSKILFSALRGFILYS